MKKVYVVQDTRKKGENGELVPRFDITPALEFGSIEYLLPPGMRVYNGRDVLGTLRVKLSEYDDSDFILCTGDPAACAIAVNAAARVNKGKVKLLVWDRKASAYIPVPVDFYHR